MRENVVGPPSTVVLTRECIERVGLCDESIAYGVDYDLWIRVAQKYHFDFVDDVVVRYSLHDGQLTKDFERVVKGHEELSRKYRASFNRDRREIASAYFDLAMLRCGEGDGVRARRALWEAIRLDPRNSRRYVFFAVSLVSPALASALRSRTAGAPGSPFPKR
jgi:hypothetical protein